MRYLIKKSSLLSPPILEIVVVEKSPSSKFWKILQSSSSNPYWIDLEDYIIIEELKSDPVDVNTQISLSKSYSEYSVSAYDYDD